jgi:hypothetical protein
MEPTLGLPKTELSRREFVRLALMSSALMMGTGTLLESEETQPGVASHAAFRSLAPGAVRPEGWLRSYLEKQAAQLGSKLPDVSWPFTREYWAEEQEGESWWPWEQNAYWIDGATRLALVLGDQALLEKVGRRIQYTLSHADDDGYLGPEFFKDPTGDFHRWPQTLFFRGLGALSDSQGKLSGVTSAQIVEAVRKHYLGDKASYGAPQRNVTNIEDILWCYERSGDARLLTLAEDAWRSYMKIAADPDHGDLSELRVYANTPINAHGVTYAETVKQPAILYMYTGKEEYLKFALAGQRRIFDHHMLIDGIPSTSEWFRTITSLDSHETCDIADHTWSWGYMLQATGDGVWADRVERACFNAAPGAIKNDWKSLQYFSCPNQFLATLDSDHNVMEHGGHMMAYQPNPGERTACCGGNVHRIFPNYAIRMWMKSKEDGLAAVLYGASKVSATVGANNEKVEIVQTTNYPFDEQIQFKINASGAVRFPLSLRIPGWCTVPKLALNGNAISMPRVERGFVVLSRSFKPGDIVTLTLPMKLKVTEWPENGMGIERGPIVYAMPIKEKWTSKVERKYTTPEFPSLEATPASAWNYGLALDKAKLESAIEVKKRTVTAEEALDPWGNPPISLTAPARKIEGWELETNPDNTAQKFTPCLPDVSISKVSETVEKITLQPYGSTQLRVTIFPVVKS